MNREQGKRVLFLGATLLLSILTLSWLVWLEVRSKPTLFDYVEEEDLALLRQNAVRFDLDELNKEGMTILAFAASAGQAESVSLLLRAGADVNGICQDSSTPLHYAVQQDRVQVVADLLEAGADPYQKNERGIYTAFVCG